MVIMFIAEISNLFFIYSGNKFTSDPAFLPITYAALALMLGYAIILYNIHRCKKTNHKTNYMLFILFGVVFLIFASYFCVLEISNKDSIYNFFLLITFIGALPLLSLKQIVPLLLITTGAFCVYILITSGNGYFIQVMLNMMLVMLFVSQLIYFTIRSSFIYRMRLQKLSETDELTGLYNRRGLQSHLEAIWKLCLEKTLPFGVIMVDIDDFKTYNDSFGHIEGDEFLKRIAKSFEEFLSEEQFAVRYGGDEFLIIVPKMALQELVSYAENLLKHIRLTEMNVRLEKHEIGTVSIGVYSGLLARETTMEEILYKADKALYKAKKDGKDRAQIYSEGM